MSLPRLGDTPLASDQSRRTRRHPQNALQARHPRPPLLHQHATRTPRTRRRTQMTLTLINADCLIALRSLPAKSVQCCVTSPPYYALRDYGVPGQIGLEETPAAFVAKMVDVLGEVWRVLRDDGTCWVNLGDSYAGGGRGGNPGTSPHVKQKSNRGSVRGPMPIPAGLKPKDLIGIPWRVAFALQADGWYLRSDIIWHKPNMMPESVSDRPTKAHEYIFLLTKSERYYYDSGAITEPCSESTHARVSQNVAAQVGSSRANGGAKTNGNMKAVVRAGVNPKAAQNAIGSRQNESFAAAICLPVSRRNKRTVWTVPNVGYSGAHFATFPPDLIKPCIMALSHSSSDAVPCSSNSTRNTAS